MEKENKKMKRKVFRYILVILIIISSERAFATAQYGDLLIIEGDTSWIDSNPLEGYFNNKGDRTIGDVEMQGTCTALWRGYVATWELIDDSLFLVRVQTGYCGDNPTEIDLSEEFNTKKVFADWVSSTIIKPEGKMLNYVHMAYMSIYEGETFYSFKDGVLSKTKKKDYLIHDDNLIFPEISFLGDTIRTIILNAVPLEERQDFNEENSCSIFISFNSLGEIEEIGLSNGEKAETLMQKIMLSKTKEALKDFPKLMKVNHERYNPPKVKIWFSGHCLKYPFDKEYRCDY
jgi:hypothetical protein